jgi:DNA helicase II / ATP-dependent DNA helicase PcrA
MAKRKNKLSKEQRNAIAYRDGMAVVLAAAGSGKTRVIERRTLALLTEHVGAGQILIVSHTNKAAEELRARVTAAPEATGVVIRTIHSLGLQILREYRTQAKLPTDFSVATVQVQLQLMDDVRADLKARGMAGIPPSRVLRETISYHRNTGVSLKASLRTTNPRTVASKRVLRKAFNRYESLKAESGLVDFDDLIIRSEELLASDKVVRKELRRRYRHIMVDEFQDLNLIQLRLLQHLGGRPRKGRSLVFVGDPGQSIFSFRGARFENWAEIRENCKKLPLSVNFRSSAPIVALANAIDDFTDAGRPAARAHKNAPRSPLPRLTIYPSKKAEAAAICDQIERLQKEGYSLANQAILFRDSDFIRHVICELRARKIPYRKIGGMQSRSAPLVQHVMAILELGTNPHHAPALMKVLQLIPGIGPKKARKLLPRLRAAGSHKELVSMLRKELKGRLGCRELVDALQAADPASPNVSHSIEQVIRSVIRLGIKVEGVSTYPTGSSQMDTILEQAKGVAMLRDVVSFWALTSNEALPDDGTETITVSTIHGAKGREWPVVYLPQLVDDHLPHRKSRTRDKIAEEGRIFYVSLTRAKRHLYLSHTEGGAAGTSSNGRPSRFLELPRLKGLLKYREVAA